MTTSNPLHILMVDDDESACFAFERFLLSEGHGFRGAATLKEASAALEEESFDVMLLDINLPDGNALERLPRLKEIAPAVSVIIVSGEGDIATAVRAGRKGADDYLTKPVEMADLTASLKKCSDIGHLRRRDSAGQRLVKHTEPFFGCNDAQREIVKHAHLAARNETIVLIQGETGTGKGVLARWIHCSGRRKDELFIELNCSCLKGDMLRSELFGHAKGAFTSAVKDHEGLIETVDRGTLFLDEISDLDAEAQAQLLKAIEEKTFRRLGENRMRHSDFRLICATNRDLLRETNEGKFRADLYYRISIFPIVLPPLRLRGDDIVPLAEYLLKEFRYSHGALSPQTSRKLLDYPWPGNIRELRNMLERAIILAQGGPLEAHHFPGLFKGNDTANGNGGDLSLKNTEERHIQRVIDLFSGNKRKAAHALDLSLSALYSRLDTYRRKNRQKGPPPPQRPEDQA
ncbi:MAG: sigma-54-dependent Fis family transcriptional regulator [Chitinispirillaceae bacterium]|nr:sigma-54-dependent Fis family transcriptional regulator [Chitinispirillaceae bacterium]